MSKNIILDGQTYNGVSEVSLPVNGGTALFKDKDEIVEPSGTKTITANGNGIDVTNYAAVDVNVQGGATPTYQEKTATANGVVTPDEGYDALSRVTVNVPAPEINLQNKTVTENGTITADAGYDGLGTVAVNVSGGTIPDDTIVVTARNSDGFATAATFYGTVVPKQAFWNYNANVGPWKNLQSVTFHDVVTELKNNAFQNCPVTSLDLSHVTKMDLALNGTKLTELNCPELLEVIGNSNFMGMTTLTTVYFPKATIINMVTTFKNCTGLTTVQLGSIGYPITTVSNNAFTGCTQEGLTITVYCDAINASAIRTNILSAATNATVVLKDSDSGEIITV